MNPCKMLCWSKKFGRNTVKIKHYWFSSKSQVVCFVCGCRGPKGETDRQAVNNWNDVHNS